MMRPEVLRQTLYLQRRSIAIWAVSLALLVAMYAALWPSIRDQPALTAVLEDLPEVLRSLLAGADMSTPIGYVQTELLALTGPLLIILFAVAAGAGGSRARRTGAGWSSCWPIPSGARGLCWRRSAP